VLLLEHPPVFTMGRSGSPAHIPGGPEAVRALGAEYVEADRGGSVTFHGPGQLVAYPIVALAARFPAVRGDGREPRGDVGAYLRALEETMCATCREVGVDARPRPPYTGAWVGDRKVGAIGVKLAHGVTRHGLALNVATDLAWFARVVPCGIPEEEGGVTSLEACGARGLTPQTLAPRLAAHLAAALRCDLGPPGRTLDALTARTAALAV
ncbi:MAG TPA: lipoyl(octanoyl) transferase LipB, partial [Candidatus Dormibacteraeota bacterium]|nr:lipoyl(octanoyl) transferase LipB [Candidatus Dormibacteraeota bacterium]